MIDMNIWLWLAQWTWVYYEIILVHTLPMLIILSKLKIDIKARYLFFLGLSIVLIGFLFDIIFINIPYPDITDELFDRNLLLEKTRNIIYFVGFVTIAFALIRVVKKTTAATIAVQQ
jgi:hypothetical protein